MSRIDNVTAKMKEEGLTQVLLTDSDAIFYLTGEMQHCGERFYGLLLKDDGSYKLFLNKLFYNNVIADEDVIYFTDSTNGAVLASEYTDHSKALGIDKNMRAEFVLKLQESNAGSSYVNGSEIVDMFRAIKDKDEQQLMINASIINDQAMLKIKTFVKEGVTEIQLADKLGEIYTELGAEGFSFPPIVSFGAHAADPHHEPDETVLHKNQCVLFDIGCVKDGYCSDMTRTFLQKNDKIEEIYEIVKQANILAEQAIKPGKKLKDIDKVARDYIASFGYGQYFTHRLGHGIGLEIHELLSQYHGLICE